MTALFAKRFVELDGQLQDLQSSIVTRYNSYNGTNYEDLDSEALLNWGVKVKSLFERLGAGASSQLQMYIDAEKHQGLESTASRLRRMRAVFLATKEDFEGGYLNSLRNLVQAEVFTSELEQAEELIKSGYATAAAVIAGVVLETTLRDLCTTHELEHGSLNKMNDDLAKASAYNASQKKRITALAAIRNSAAHGKPEEFTAADVRGMIDDVERFLATTLH
ncbi:DUF4145 domain-containing protein [Pseudomonas sp. P5_152]|uniref:DUF4145 domain-containing protein n=1 Tax=Pseudomonas sp. P5_152 TaxID=3043442 RepID=UPI002A36B731|nr:DUF4145 domain-containing protein [Pseudomonas sp. P5_152]MDX9667344.1 DUF4145 domain-containing protein [Pseudomonas sp. P5_152]